MEESRGQSSPASNQADQALDNQESSPQLHDVKDNSNQNSEISPQLDQSISSMVNANNSLPNSNEIDEEQKSPKSRGKKKRTSKMTRKSQTSKSIVHTRK